jgi:hypothetical protein
MAWRLMFCLRTVGDESRYCDSCYAYRKETSASPFARAVRPRVVTPPSKMRPKRYLREESKQFGHDCPPLLEDWTGFFFQARELSHNLARLGLTPGSCPSPDAS